MELRQSNFDANFWEVVSGGVVIQEIPISFPLRTVPLHFNDLQEIYSWLEKTEYKLAKNAALRLLARRSYSKSILFNKLREKNFSERLSVKVIHEFEKLGYLSDSDYAQSLLAQKIGQGYGPRYIEQYFRMKGLDPKLVQMDIEAQRASVKKWTSKLKGKDPKKRVAFLLRKGFALDIIRSV